ncbi:hypothetical protein Y032_0116g557 [Ancylostoma ceylanicum]|uniref:Uncharacterized protein n=1 Tax=Ancylostoma ceylanicum TaxID=53326 RepID=A0A016TCD3_9BILA|nr:hypothetical protein Y032_0116g557 [Ancylostoma ceylanicum]
MGSLQLLPPLGGQQPKKTSCNLPYFRSRTHHLEKIYSSLAVGIPHTTLANLLWYSELLLPRCRKVLVRRSEIGKNSAFAPFIPTIKVTYRCGFLRKWTKPLERP